MGPFSLSSASSLSFLEKTRRSPGVGRARSFTLVELLVVVAIIAVLASLLIPSLQSGIARAQQSKCSENMRQVYALEMAFAGDNDNRIGRAAGFTDYPANTAFMTWSDWLTGMNGHSPYMNGVSPTRNVTNIACGIFLCPSQAPGGYAPGSGTIYRTYGMLHIPGPVMMGGYQVQDWIHDGWQFLTAVPAPAKIPLLADTVTMSGTTAKLQFYYFYPDRLDAESGIHFRHHGTANILFYDGHVAALTPQEVGNLGIGQGISATYQQLTLSPTSP